jgi:hypothetical protein
MSGPGEEANITNRPIAPMSTSETELLNVGNAFYDEADRKQDDTCDITTSPESWLVELGHIRRVQNRDRERTRPYPEHLEDPEAQKGPKLITLVVEPIVFSGLQDSEQEKAAQSCGPGHDKDGGDDIASLISVSATCESENGENDKVGTTSEICELVELEAVSPREEEQLQTKRCRVSNVLHIV